MLNLSNQIQVSFAREPEYYNAQFQWRIYALLVLNKSHVVYKSNVFYNFLNNLYKFSLVI